MKKYLNSFLCFFIPFIVLLFIATLFYYFDILSTNGMKYVKFIIVLLSVFLGGFKIGKQTNQKGYQKGLIFGGIIVILFLLINLITKNLKVSSIIYYLLILLTSTISSMIGILKKN